MPIFVDSGPDVTGKPLQAHAEGNVVFFCGAGISCLDGLPGFAGLVKRLYKNLNVQFD